jgi:hypothetical protein
VPASTRTPLPIAESALTRRYLHRVRPEPAARRARLAGLPIAAPDRFLPRPVLLDAAEHASLSADVAQVFDLLADLPHRLFGGDLARYAAAVGMTGGQAELALRGAGPRPVRFGRADVYRDDTGFRLLEFNLGSAVGGMEIGEVCRAELADPATARFAAEQGLTYADPLAALVETMTAVYPELAGRRPVVALTDWPASFTELAPYLRHVAHLLSGHGVDALACHLGELEYTAAGVRVHGRRVDVVHRFVLPPDHLDGADAPARIGRLLAAAESGAVRLFTPLDSELYGNKAALALLSEHAADPRFAPAERSLIERFLPVTRFVRDDETLPDVLRHRAEHVLKPSLDYGGRSVVAGWTVGPAQWEASVRRAVGTGAVVQRRVRPVAERHPGAEPMFVNYGVFLAAGGYAGATARGGADPDVGVLSMSAGARPGCVLHARR